ncbi:10084_t:CDS:2, partial [Racocetra fulgida]
VATYEDYEIEDKCYDDGGDNDNEPVNKVEENPDEEQGEDQEKLGELNQSIKIASLTSFESIIASQQQQLDHIIKIEELLHVISNKISEQETDIKSLKSQIGEASSRAKIQEITG